MTGVVRRSTPKHWPAKTATIVLLVTACTRGGAPANVAATPPGPNPSSSLTPPPGPSAAPGTSSSAAASPKSAALAVPPGYAILAHANANRASWSFELEPVEGRTLVSACLVSSGRGCQVVELRELNASGWAEVPELLPGLPELGRVNLRSDPQGPWRAAGPHDGACASDSYLRGTRSIATFVGRWPDNAWILLSEQGEEWASRVSRLYRWQGGRWVLTFSSPKVGDFFESLVPWQNGVAGLETVLTAPGPDRLKVTAFGDGGKAVLADMPNDRLSSPVLARLGGALVLSGVLDGGVVELVAWTLPTASRKYRVRSPHSYAGATWNGQTGTVFFQSSEESYQAVEVTFDQNWREVGRRTLSEAELEKLTGDERERRIEAGSGISVERAWNRQGTEWWFVRRPPENATGPAESWLLRQGAAGAIWELREPPLRPLPGAPAGAGCE